MRFSRHLVLLLLFALLFAQQAGAAHALHHAYVDLTHKQDKQAPHSDACEKCAAYAQLGNALGASAYAFEPLAVADGAAQQRPAGFVSIHTLPAVARGPPRSGNST